MATTTTTTTTPADVLSSADALAILDEINHAERRRAHYAAQGVPVRGFEATIAEGRAWLAQYGYRTRLSARTGAYVPDGGGHGWQYVSGARVAVD